MSEHGDAEDPRLEELGRLLGRVASEEESVLREAAALETAPGAERVDAMLERAWSEPAGRRPRRWLPLAAVALAAASVALSVLLWRGDAGGPEPGPGGGLLGSGVEIVRPRGAVPRWDVVEWSGPPGARYVVSIFDPASEATLFGPERTTATRLDLTGIAEGWPDRIRIEIGTHEPGGRLLGILEEEAWLSR